jgi:hypothetical protein
LFGRGKADAIASKTSAIRGRGSANAARIITEMPISSVTADIARLDEIGLTLALRGVKTVGRILVYVILVKNSLGLYLAHFFPLLSG